MIHYARTDENGILQEVQYLYPEQQEPVQGKPGDANCDGFCDVADAVLIARFANEDKDAVITDQGRQNADVTHDGNVDSQDAAKILQYIAKKISYEEFAADSDPLIVLTDDSVSGAGVRTSSASQSALPPLSDVLEMSNEEALVLLQDYTWTELRQIWGVNNWEYSGRCGGCWISGEKQIIII